jgi:RNA polymerase sigma-70 factor (TIGR02960 family)
MSMRGSAAVTDSAEFVAHTEPFRRELLAYCYRMLGSVEDAEDAVQETYLRAWRSFGRFEGRSSVRTWLYRIATNVCLTALQRRGRRALPSDLEDPSENPEAPPSAARSEATWLQPMPDAMVMPESDDPAAIVASRAGIRLALIASLQYLLPRERAVLILRDVLAWPAADVAEVVGRSTASVKSTLQRARARLGEQARLRMRSLSRSNQKPAPCSTNTSRPSRTPTRPRWNRSWIRTSRSSCRRRRPGSRAATRDGAPSWALVHQATGG